MTRIGPTSLFWGESLLGAVQTSGKMAQGMEPTRGPTAAFMTIKPHVIGPATMKATPTNQAHAMACLRWSCKETRSPARCMRKNRTSSGTSRLIPARCTKARRGQSTIRGSSPNRQGSIPRLACADHPTRVVRCPGKQPRDTVHSANEMAVMGQLSALHLLNSLNGPRQLGEICALDDKSGSGC